MADEMTEIERRFSYHPPCEDQLRRYERIRGMAKELALVIEVSVPDCRERALAVTHLDAAVMWANAGVARHKEDANGDEAGI